jgi:hypothetical protein
MTGTRRRSERRRNEEEETGEGEKPKGHKEIKSAKGEMFCRGKGKFLPII